ncbi:Glycoside hydrolase family 15 protein [Mycena sanguinolenta]|uniref:glucan 1,4-alpha-glucosidase n=1 Tax=Mycena sanguinolenta TaxID=230812 RepID=A0A8H7CS68_9AGAR|nr:Glycoside hydrolase family 15 protein [Mycena sanguinolenta]
MADRAIARLPNRDRSKCFLICHITRIIVTSPPLCLALTPENSHRHPPGLIIAEKLPEPDHASRVHIASATVSKPNSRAQSFAPTKMRISLLSALSVSVAVLAQTSVDSYIATESPIAKAGVLANIGPSGSKSQGAKAGVVIASPSTTNPDYLFTWTRDSSLVFKALIDQFTSGADTTLLGQIQNFVTAEAIIQQVPNPSGTVSTGGLGEPHYNIDETAFTGAWGRPQRDGPALRATAMINYANWLIKNTTTANVLNTLWPIIKLDLDYVASDWNQTTFDLWEEVSSSSFFTTAVQHRALREGATLATALGQTSVVSNYQTQAANILCFLQSYWNPTGGYITANTGGGRSGKDANTALASIHTFDPAAGCDAATFQPCSDKALSSLKVYVDAFRSIYTINSGIASNAAVATGRYPEDSYMGGNPWYLATSAVAEQLYDALIVWNAQGELNVTSTSLAFFQQFLPSVAVGTYTSSTSTFTTLTAAVKTFADGFIGVVAKYTPAGGGLAEQYSRSNGAPVSAVDLTWSYAAALTAFSARAGVTSPGWGAAGLVVPTTCQTSGSGTGGSGGAGTVSVTFNVVATTVEGEDIYITGSVPSLQNWSPDTALILNPANYPTWSITVDVPASSDIQYKYIRKVNGVLTAWEADPNNEFESPASGSLVRNDVWNGASGTGGSGTVSVTFNVVATTVEGEDIYIAGNVASLENWSPDAALILNPANYPTWSITVNVPASSDIQYKYIRKMNGGADGLGVGSKQRLRESRERLIGSQWFAFFLKK